MAKKEKKRSFFERLTGSVRMTEDADTDTDERQIRPKGITEDGVDPWQQAGEEAEGELAIDVYQTPTDVIVETFVAGVRPEDLEINITRDMLTIRGKRQEMHKVHKGDFFCQELYWGTFSRTVSLPQEVEPDDAEAMERHGLLTIKLPKIDKNKKSNVRVKSV